MKLHAFSSRWEPAPRPMPPDMTLLAIGDVHGHLAHLDALLGVLAAEIAAARDAGNAVELVLIGDYVDRGPDSLGVLRRLCELPQRLGIPVHALRGNHDHYLIEFLLNDEPDPEALEGWCGNGGDTTLTELGVTPEDVVARDPAELAARARDAIGEEVLGLLRELQPHRSIGAYTLVHAGVHPDRPLAEQGLREALWLREPFLGTRNWRHPFTVVHGHTIRGPEVHPHRIALDSGVYRTGVLSAVQIQEQRLRFWCVTSDPKRKAFRRLAGLAQPRRFTSPKPLPAG